MISFQHFNEKCDIVQWEAMNAARKVNCLTTATQCNTAEMQRAIHPRPAHLTESQPPPDRPQGERKKLTSICRIDKPALSAYCVTDTMGGREILPPLLILTSYKASEH